MFNYLKVIKLFYMKGYLICDDVYVCVDFLVLEGYGEIIGGFEWEIDYEILC